MPILLKNPVKIDCSAYQKHKWLGFFAKWSSCSETHFDTIFEIFGVAHFAFKSRKLSNNFQDNSQRKHLLHNTINNSVIAQRNVAEVGEQCTRGFNSENQWIEDSFVGRVVSCKGSVYCLNNFGKSYLLSVAVSGNQHGCDSATMIKVNVVLWFNRSLQMS